MTVQEAAALWGCSVRSVQMLCRKGTVPGARKVSGVWLLPASAVHTRYGRAQTVPAFHPERFYGSNTTVRVVSGPEERRAEQNGCTVTQYQILRGITLVFQDIHEEKLDYGSGLPQFPADLIAIQHCREGRFEGEYPNGECIYMGPGSLSVNLPAWAPVSNSFPLRHYHGFYIAILPGMAEQSIRALEKILGSLAVDVSVLSEQLFGKNRLALYDADETAAQLLASFYASHEKGRKEQLKLQVLELLQLLSTREMLQPVPEQYFTRDQVKTVKEIRQYLIAHLDQHIPLPELASRFRISLTGMKSCFKGVYGQSVGRYLREYRMQAGAEQLAATGLRIIDIAASLGYENASKFSEAFSGYYGVSPSVYRKNFCLPGGLPDGKG